MDKIPASQPYVKQIPKQARLSLWFGSQGCRLRRDESFKFSRKLTCLVPKSGVESKASPRHFNSIPVPGHPSTLPPGLMTYQAQWVLHQHLPRCHVFRLLLRGLTAQLVLQASDCAEPLLLLNHLCPWALPVLDTTEWPLSLF